MAGVAPLALQQSQVNKPSHMTPRSAQSPRRQPEMPTIVEEENEDYESPERPPRNIFRPFERTLYQMETPNGGGLSLTRCYELRWPDGTSRRIYGI